VSEANPSPAFCAPGNPDKSIFAGTTSGPDPGRTAAPGNGSGKSPSAAGDPGGTPVCCPHAPTPAEVKAMFRGGD
jgi:hypothetical protein